MDAVERRRVEAQRAQRLAAAGQEKAVERLGVLDDRPPGAEQAQ